MCVISVEKYVRMICTYIKKKLFSVNGVKLIKFLGCTLKNDKSELMREISRMINKYIEYLDEIK